MKLAPLCLALVITALAVSSATAATYTYTFDYPGRIGPGTLAGQDNWMVLTGSGDSSDIIVNGGPNDNTNVMQNPNLSGVHRMGRTNDANFSFGSMAGAIGLTLSFDVQVHNISSGSDEFINFALADANQANGSPAFAFRDAVSAGSSFSGGPTFPAGLSIAFGSSASSPNAFALPPTTTGHWIQLSLMMNFLTPATGGTLTYRDLTAGGALQTITSGLNLGNPIATEALWNTMWSRSDLASGVELDNLSITPTFVPEMNGAWMAGAAAVLLTGHFVRRRVRRIGA